MPVEIRELIIRAAVSTKPEAQPSETPALSDEAFARLVQQCVQQALRILRKEQER